MAASVMVEPYSIDQEREVLLSRRCAVLPRNLAGRLRSIVFRSSFAAEKWSLC